MNIYLFIENLFLLSSSFNRTFYGPSLLGESAKKSLKVGLVAEKKEVDNSLPWLLDVNIFSSHKDSDPSPEHT